MLLVSCLHVQITRDDGKKTGLICFLTSLTGITNPDIISIRFVTSERRRYHNATIILIMLKATPRLKNLSSLLLPVGSHSRRRLTTSTMKPLTINSKYPLLSRHQIPVLGYGVRLFLVRFHRNMLSIDSVFGLDFLIDRGFAIIGFGRLEWHC